MANARGKELDKTFLSIDNAESRGFLHRDYIAHCLRWTHVIKRMTERKQYETARILDVGCGRELPFPKTLYSSRLIPEVYVGVDAGPINDDARAMVQGGKLSERASLFPNKPLLDIKEDFFRPGWFTHITCFEVLEHVEPKMMLAMIDRMKHWLDPKDGRMFISTPCWDRKSCAANHVNEMTYEALGAVFEESGLVVENVHGTFASIRDYEPHLTPAYREVFKDLRDYYDTNFLSVVLAPMFPAYARNCLWELRVAGDGDVNYHKFDRLEDCEPPWGSSNKWAEMDRDARS